MDILNREIRFYLAGLGQENMTAEQADRQLTLITLTADMENAGDTINKNLLALARKKAAAGLQFSEEGLRDITFFHQKVVENFDLAMAAFSDRGEEARAARARHTRQPREIEASSSRAIRAPAPRPAEALDTSSITSTSSATAPRQLPRLPTCAVRQPPDGAAIDRGVRRGRKFGCGRSARSLPHRLCSTDAVR